MINTNDTFISDEEEELCPLCVEEMDISDKNFKPCPCGYQVCQFCYNNIRQNPELNGRCPACRRPYDDESVEYKIVSPEEWKLEQSKQSRKDRERKQKEKEKKENEQANRKHLAGMRVIQKNLVYVVGLNPPVPADELHTVLRSDKYFGQYGKILKIVINKRNPLPNSSSSSNIHGLPPSSSSSNGGNSGFGVYVTFSKKEEATRCINAIDGTYIDNRLLKAAHGTTKYCSSYLRGQPCPNPNCMFLHEPGEEADSYTRQDLSTRQGLKMDNEDSADTHYLGAVPGSSSSQATASLHDNHASSHMTNINTNITNHNEPSPTISTPTVSSNVMPVLSSAPLPATSSWANSNSGTNLSSMNKTAAVSSPTIESAFPTLAESTSLQQLQQQQQLLHHQQQQQQRKQKLNSQNQSFINEFNVETSSALFIEDTVHFMNSLPNITSFGINKNLVNKFGIHSPFPDMFTTVNATANSSKESSLTDKFVDSLIPRTLAPPSAYLEYLNLQSQQPSQVQAQAQAQAQAPPQQPQPQFPSQQELQYLQQLQQQQLQQQQQQLQQQQQQQQLQQQLQQIKNDRQFTATPPPPGLFNPQTQSHTPTMGHAEPHPVNGTASELLNHLMNGKKISA